MVFGRRNTCSTAVAAVFGLLLFAATVHGADSMKFLYDLHGALELKPQEFEATGGLFGTRLLATTQMCPCFRCHGARDGIFLEVLNLNKSTLKKGDRPVALTCSSSS